MKEKIMQILSENHVDGFFVSKIENVRYLSGYTSDDACLLLTSEKNYFITDPRYTEQASAECKDFEVIDWRSVGASMAAAIASEAKKNNIKTLGFESDVLTFSAYTELAENFKGEMVPMEKEVEKLRSIKTPYEIDCQRTACQISCRALERVMKDIRVGVSEKEIGAKLSYYMVNEGGDPKPYGQIVIAGARTSLLHGIPSEYEIKSGDFVLLDFGCGYKGYLSDMTRTFVVGNPTAKQREVYELERRMEQDSLDVMKAGTTGREVYEASIRAITGTEYMPYHYGGIGHGIGLFVHEIPFMGIKNEIPLKKNSVVTIEPGIYIPGWGGVRIEDQVVIEDGGHENLVNFPKELIEL
ncbi:MAG: Xaa-Pro peptidase family protein [Oscillospiraceae bacterium]